MTASGLEQARVVITGGAAGIGLAVAQHFAALGAKVAAIDRDPLPSTDGIVGFVADVTDQQKLDAVFADIAQPARRTRQ